MGVPPARVSLGVCAGVCQGVRQGVRRSARGRSKEAGTEWHPRSPRHRLRVAPREVTRGHSGLRGNNSDS